MSAYILRQAFLMQIGS